MKRLTCEMCGSTDIIKQDGVYVCQSCGTKYSVEEARKLMIEGTVEVKGTVKIDNNEQIQNYLTMAQNAFESDNYTEAEKYSNKVIELDGQNGRAWKIKGSSASRQNLGSNVSLEKAFSAWTKACEYATAEEKQQLQKEIAGEISSVCGVFIVRWCEDFSNKSNDNFKKSLFDNICNMFNLINNWTNSQNVNFDMSEISKILSRGMYKSAGDGFVNLSNLCHHSYSTLSPEAKSSFLDLGYAILAVLEQAKLFSRSTDEAREIVKTQYNIANILINQIGMQIGNVSKIMEFVHLKSEMEKYTKEKDTISYDNLRNRVISKISGNREQAEKTAAIKKYWADHADQKVEIDQKLSIYEGRLKELDAKIQELEGKKASLYAEKEEKTDAEKSCIEIEKKIDSLNSELGSLGLFKGKRKKEIYNELDSLGINLSDTESIAKRERNERNTQKDSEISVVDSELVPLYEEQKKLKDSMLELNNELTKDRGILPAENLYYIENLGTKEKFTIKAKDYYSKLCEVFLENGLNAFKLLTPKEVGKEIKVFQDVNIERVLTGLGKYHSMGTMYTKEDPNNWESKITECDTYIFAEDEEGSLNAVVIDLPLNKKFEDFSLEGWVKCGSLAMMTLMKNMSMTEGEKQMADLVMSDKPQSFEKDGIIGTIHYISDSRYPSKVHIALVLRHA